MPLEKAKISQDIQPSNNILNSSNIESASLKASTKVLSEASSKTSLQTSSKTLIKTPSEEKNNILLSQASSEYEQLNIKYIKTKDNAIIQKLLQQLLERKQEISNLENQILQYQINYIYNHTNVTVENHKKSLEGDLEEKEKATTKTKIESAAVAEADNLFDILKEKIEQFINNFNIIYNQCTEKVNQLTTLYEQLQNNQQLIQQKIKAIEDNLNTNNVNNQNDIIYKDIECLKRQYNIIENYINTTTGKILGETIINNTNFVQNIIDQYTQLEKIKENLSVTELNNSNTDAKINTDINTDTNIKTNLEENIKVNRNKSNLVQNNENNIDNFTSKQHIRKESGFNSINDDNKQQNLTVRNKTESVINNIQNQNINLNLNKEIINKQWDNIDNHINDLQINKNIFDEKLNADTNTETDINTETKINIDEDGFVSLANNSRYQSSFNSSASASSSKNNSNSIDNDDEEEWISYKKK